MSNFKNPDGKTVSALLGLAASKLGTSPDRLAGELKNGRADSVLRALPEDQRAKLGKALADPGTAERILSSPQARALIEKLSKK